MRRRPGLRLAGAVAAVGLLASCTTAGPDDATSPVAVDPAHPTRGSLTTCRALVSALPEVVADHERRDVSPDEGTTAAWGSPATVLRCGVAKPKGFNRFSSCTVVNDVDWFVPDEWPETGSLVFTTVGRDVYVEVALPVEHLPPAATMATLADAITSTTTVVKPCG